MLNKSYVGHTVSHGTLRYVDLITATWEFLNTHGQKKTVEYLKQCYPIVLTMGDMESAIETLEETDPEYLAYVYESLCDALNIIAPEGTYFGSHPGDGSLLGFWEIEVEDLENNL